jgi:hypothetical protein
MVTGITSDTFIIVGYHSTDCSIYFVATVKLENDEKNTQI